MNLTSGQIILFVLVILANLVAFFAFVSLIITTFTSGGGAASCIHSSVSMIGGVVAKIQSEAGSGATDTVSQVKIWLEMKLTESVVVAMGLSKAVFDRLSNAGKELEAET